MRLQCIVGCKSGLVISSFTPAILKAGSLLVEMSGSRVYIGNLGDNASKREIETEFEYYGPLKDVWVARNPPGFAFCVFEDRRDAEDAVRDLDGKYICGVKVRVELARGPSRGGSRAQRLGLTEKCYECGRVGHFARDCTRASRGGRRSSSRSPQPERRRKSSRSRSRSPRRRRSRERTPERKYRSRSKSGSRDRGSRDRGSRDRGSRDKGSRDRDRRSRSGSNERKRERSRSRSNSPQQDRGSPKPDDRNGKEEPKARSRSGSPPPASGQTEES